MPTRPQYRREFYSRTGLGVDSTCTSAGTATTLIDTQLQDSRLSSEEHENKWIFRPNAAAAANQVRRVSTFATATLTHGGVDYSAVPASAEEYELALIDPREVNKFVSRVLRQLRYEQYAFLTLIADGNQHDNNTTQWTVSNSAVSKVTTAANVHMGRRSLRVLNSGADGYARTASMKVIENAAYFVGAFAQADVGTARLQAYNVTDSAIFDAVTHDEEAWMFMWFIFNTGTGDEEMQIRLVGDEASADVYWGPVILYRIGQRRFDVPIASEPRELQDILAWYERGVGGPVSQTRIADAPVWQPWSKHTPLMAEVSANPLRVVLDPPAGQMGGALPLAKLHLPYPDLTDETTTSAAPLDLVVAGMQAYCYDWLKRTQPEGLEAYLQRLGARDIKAWHQWYENSRLPQVVRL